MAYQGASIPIPLGDLGLKTDAPMTSLPPNALIKANNVSLYSGAIEKSRGSSRFNTTSFASAVVSVHDWYPDPTSQRLIAITAAGNVYRDTGSGTFNTNAILNNVEVQKITFSALPDGGTVTFRLDADASTALTVVTGTTAAQIQANLRAGITALASCVVVMRQATLGAAGTDLSFYVHMLGTTGDQTIMDFSANSLTSGGPAVTIAFTEIVKGGVVLGTLTPDTHMLTGGAESQGRNKKLFIFSGQSQIKVISGDTSYYTTLQLPSSDWATSSFPTYGILYQGRLCAIGSSADRHRAYLSLATDHEDFTTTPLTFPIFPGEADGLIGAAVYRGLLFLFKRPFGVYIIDGTDPNTANWTVSRYSDSFGVASPHSTLQALNDLISSNAFGSYTSLQATQAFGDFEAGDMLALAQIENYIRGQFNGAGLPYVHGVYYPEKKLAMFTGQATSGSARNRILKVDFAKQQPRYSIETKDTVNCLALRRDTNNIPRPMYGDATGYVWLMDQATYAVNSLAYTGEFQTAYTDFSFTSGELAGKNKIFDFIEVNYIPTGNNNFYLDVFIDGTLRQTLTFTQYLGVALDAFRLDTDALSGDASGKRNRKQILSCTGERISCRIYNSNVSEGFKIERIIVGFRISDDQVYDAQV